MSSAYILVLFLTAKIKDEDKIAGFLAGADDYLTKPFNVDELVLRVRAILRRVKLHGAALAPEIPTRSLDKIELTASARQALQQLRSKTQTPGTNHCLVVGDYGFGN